MKNSLILLVLLLLPCLVYAQDDMIPSKTTAQPSMVAGAMADVHAFFDVTHPSLSLPLLGFGGIVFIRKYMGRHLALELEANINMSEKTFGYDIGPTPSNSYSYKTRSLDFPLHLQYHFGKGTAQLRPYAGLGVGYAIYDSYVGNTDYSTGTRIDYVYQSRFNTMLIQLTEGITYHVNRKLQINQSVYYKMITYQGFHNIGLRFGLGYTIM